MGGRGTEVVGVNGQSESERKREGRGVKGKVEEDGNVRILHEASASP